MKKLIFLTICLFPLILSHQCYPSCSTDPNSLTPIMGTIWKFDYVLNYYPFSRIIGFGREIFKNTNGEVALKSADVDTDGLVMYGQFTNFETETGFICTFTDSPPINEFEFFMFHIDGNSAIGHYAKCNSLTPEYVQTSNLIGIKIADIQEDQNQPNLPIDQNQPDIPADSNQQDISDSPIQPINEDKDSNSSGCFIFSLTLQFPSLDQQRLW